MAFRSCRGKPGLTAATGRGRRQEGQGAGRSSSPLELLPGAAIAWVAAGHRRFGPAAARGRNHRAAPTPGGPAAPRPLLRTSRKVFVCSSGSRPGTRSGGRPPGARAQAAEGRGPRGGPGSGANPPASPSSRCPPSPPSPRPAPANPQALCPARRAPSPDAPPASGSPTLGITGVPGSHSGPRAPGDGRSGPTYLKTSPLLQLAKVRPKSPGKSQVSSCC